MNDETAPVYKRPSFSQARSILVKHCLELVGEKPSTNKTPHKHQNTEGRSEQWWLAHQGHVPKFDNPRSIVYLKAYAEIAGPCFYGTGIPLTDAFLHPDRGVMKALLIAECVELDNRGRFVMTDRGLDLVSLQEGTRPEDPNTSNDG